MKKRSISLCNLTGMAVGLIVAAGMVTQSSANVVMALTFDEPPQAQGTSTPFLTADISGSNNNGYVHDGPGATPPFNGPAFSGFNPINTQFAPAAGDANTPAGPFGGGPGHYMAVMSGDYVEVTPPGTPGQTPNNDLSFAGDFTVEFWFRTSEQTFQMFALDDSVGTRNTIKFWMQGGAGPGKVSLNLNGVEGEGPFLLTDNTYNDAQWHHVAAVRDATAGMGYLHMDGGLVNGGETKSAAVNGTWTWSEPYTGGGSAAYRFNGSGDNAWRSIFQVDDLRISTIARTEAELGFHAPIPEPASLALLLVGAGLLNVFRRRR